MKNLPLFSILCAIVVIVGCSPKEDTEALQALPKPQAEFKGSVDPKIVGFWATKDSKQHLSLDKDGTARMQATVGTRIGPQKIDSRMEWKVDAGTIAFKDQNGVVSKFQIKVSDTELELKSLRSLTTYLRQK